MSCYSVMSVAVVIVSLNIYGDTNHASHFANSIDSNALDFENFTSLKYLHLEKLHYKDVIGLNLSNLRECDIDLYIKLDCWQESPTPQHLIDTFYHCDIDSFKQMKSLKLSYVEGLALLRQSPERNGHLDLRGLENLTELVLHNLAYSDVVNLQALGLHSLQFGFNEKQRAPLLMATLLTHGTFQTEIGLNEDKGNSIKELFNLCDNSISTVCVFGSTLIR
ncbi:hypothetical protein MAR_002664 [Mya arenaria]|uniref:Toll-like receptor 4 n=1 Tax=Mya arenaria TaxID=6604 RepID=A0ABY7GD11_MYAAR|nr:hypothetical protein MAR_002664 [Mya arenaria]